MNQVRNNVETRHALSNDRVQPSLQDVDSQSICE